jgi:beta-galactosidase
MLPHAGTDSELWAAVVGLGRDLQKITEVTGSTVTSPVALVLDYEAWWAAELDAHPSDQLRYRRTAERWYRALWEANISVDVVPRATDLTGYRVVLAPMLHLASDADVDALETAASAGAQVLVTYFSGIVDEHDHMRLGGYPGAFKKLLGVRADEFRPLLPEQIVHVAGELVDQAAGTLWSEPVVATDAEVLARYTDGPSAGYAAVTRADRGEGDAWYVSTELDADALRAVVDAVCKAAGVAASVIASPGIEVVVRHGDGVEYVFAANHADVDGTVEAGGRDLLTERDHDGPTLVPAHEVVVLRR